MLAVSLLSFLTNVTHSYTEDFLDKKPRNVFTLTKVNAALVGNIFLLLTALTVARTMDADMFDLLFPWDLLELSGHKHLGVEADGKMTNIAHVQPSHSPVAGQIRLASFATDRSLDQ